MSCLFEAYAEGGTREIVSNERRKDGDKVGGKCIANGPADDDQPEN